MGDSKMVRLAEVLAENPDALKEAEDKELARKNSITARIKSIYQLGEANWWMADSIKPREALLRYPGDDNKLMMPRGEVCSLVGSDGVGKSRILTQLCLSIATGSHFLDTYIPEAPGRVLYICGEEDDEEIKRRLFYAIKDANLQKSEMIKLIGKNFRSLSQKGRDTRLQTNDLSESDIAKELLQAATVIAEKDGLALVVLDPMSWFAGNDTEKDSIAATQFSRICQKFTEICGHPTVLICHHTGKAAQKDSKETEDASTTDMRGSSGLSAAFRFGINIVKLKSPKGEAWRGQTYLKFLVKKNNYGPEDHEGIMLRVAHPGVVKKMSEKEIEAFDAARNIDNEAVHPKADGRFGKGNKRVASVANDKGRSDYRSAKNEEKFDERTNGRP